jgi:uncharacterized protein YdeI (YjbR/CyaY-like superfamily)
MNKKQLPGGVAHQLPKDLEKVIASHQKLLTMWEDITPLARNEWICWVTSTKKEDTRARRIRILNENLTQGIRRPCCWAGCSHRY